MASKPIEGSHGGQLDADRFKEALHHNSGEYFGMMSTGGNEFSLMSSSYTSRDIPTLPKAEESRCPYCSKLKCGCGHMDNKRARWSKA